MNIRDELNLLRLENANMRKALSDIANLRGQMQWDERNFGSFAVALATRAQMALDASRNSVPVS